MNITMKQINTLLHQSFTNDYEIKRIAVSTYNEKTYYEFMITYSNNPELIIKISVNELVTCVYSIISIEQCFLANPHLLRKLADFIDRVENL